MRITFEVFAKKLFGGSYERLGKAVLIRLIVFWGLRIAGFRIPIASFILYLTTGTYSASIMWQGLSSEESKVHMENLLMLPFDGRRFIFSYVAALGIHTVFVRTGSVLAVVLAVSEWSISEVVGSLLCIFLAVLMTAAVYSWKKYRWVGFLWAGAVGAVFILAEDSFLPVAMWNILLALFCLNSADAYSFYRPAEAHKSAEKPSGRPSVWKYLFRYLAGHKKYLVNTAAMWGIACVLPLFFREMDVGFVMPVGFAILSLNTPLCILLSCDPALEQAVRFLPGQKAAFCVPYCSFLFLCNMAAGIIYICSWQIQVGGIDTSVMITAVFFALQSAVASVLLEWFFPVKGWKTESDLWHHPRKYVVPGFMMVMAGMTGTLPWSIDLWISVLGMECMVLFLICRRC